MKKTVKFKLLTLIILISLGNVFGQNSNNKIIFLNDYYSAYADTTENGTANLDNHYKEKKSNCYF